MREGKSQNDDSIDGGWYTGYINQNYNDRRKVFLEM